MSRLVEGLWDCPYCDAKGIGGLQKTCPNCGHPQDKGTKFYLQKEVRHLNEEESKQVGTKQDWICAYCGSYNNDKYAFCTNCGGSREEQQGTYFSQEQKPEKKKKEPEPVEKKKSNFFKDHPIRTVLMVLGMLLLVSMVKFFFVPEDHNGVIQGKTWERNIQAEEYGTVREDDWTIPDGGRLVETRREIRSYRQVLDHYETRTRQVSYEVQDGYDTQYQDNGNGTFEEISVPRYRTEYRTEEYEEPVYRNEPVYDTKYYYDIDRWYDIETDTASGDADTEPHWPETNYAENQREKSRDETYTLECYDEKKEKSYSYDCTLSEWETFSVGQKIDFTIKAGEVIEVK